MSFQVFQAQGLRIYAGDTATVNSYVGLAGELAINIETKSVRILDGVNPGGVPLTTTNGPELKGLNIEQLANLLVTTPKNGEALVYQDGKWTNQAVATQSSTAASNLGELLDVTLTNLQSNQVLSYNAVLAGWENKAVATVDHDHDLRYQAKGDYLMPTSNISELNNVQITMPEDGQSLVYDEGYQKWINTTLAGVSGGVGGSEGFKGCIIQTQHNPYQNYPVSADQNWVDAQVVNFTPKSAKSKILIMINYGIGGKGSVCLLRNGSAISAAPNGGESYMFWQHVNQTSADANSERQSMSMMIEDEPNTTDTITYKTQIIGYSENGIMINPTPFRQGNGVFSGMTIFEIGDESELGGGGGGTIVSETSPIGMIAPFAMENAPDEWLVCDGSTLNSVANPEYADLFAAIGTTWGGTGSSSFSLPDLRGAFLRGTGSHASSTMANGSAFLGQNVGSFENDSFQSHLHEFNNYTYHSNGANSELVGMTGQPPMANDGGSGSGVGSPKTDGTNGTPRTGDENRPFNAGVLYCIKYKAASGSAVLAQPAYFDGGYRFKTGQGTFTAFSGGNGSQWPFDMEMKSKGINMDMSTNTWTHSEKGKYILTVNYRHEGGDVWSCIGVTKNGNSECVGVSGRTGSISSGSWSRTVMYDVDDTSATYQLQGWCEGGDAGIGYQNTGDTNTVDGTPAMPSWSYSGMTDIPFGGENGGLVFGCVIHKVG